MLLSQKKKRILICFDSASHRVQPTVPTFFLLSDTDQSNNTQIMRTGNNNDSITIINNNNNNNNNNIYDNNRSNCITWMKGYHLQNRLLIWSIRNFSKNMRISNIAKYTVKSRFPGGTSSCQFWVLPIDCPPGWTFLGDYNNKEWIKLSLFSWPQLVGKSLQRARYILQCNNNKLHVM